MWKIHQGQPLRRGPYTTEQEAYQRGFEELGSDFEVVELQTRDPKRARDTLRDLILQRTGNLDLALKRFRNQPQGLAK